MGEVIPRSRVEPLSLFFAVDQPGLTRAVEDDASISVFHRGYV